MSACFSLQSNAVQRHGYSPLCGIFKAACKLATYSKQDPHRFLNFFTVSSNTSSVFLYSSKSACFEPWNFIDYPRQIRNNFVLLSFALLLAVLGVPALPLSPIRCLYIPVIPGMQQCLWRAGGDENARTGNMAVAGHCKHSWVHWLMLCWDGMSE